MSCANCANYDESGKPKGCKNNGTCSTGGCNKLEVFDWLSNIELPAGQSPFDCVEIRFKNNRKNFFRNTTDIQLTAGDVVVVESSPGHDVGVVSLTGELVRMQMGKKKVSTKSSDIRKIYRKAHEEDISKWRDAREMESATMHRARKLAAKYKLKMKISDVEFQGDKGKATFYYTAEDRVDFRELIREMATEFSVRVEMRQIGSRQEAGRLGGIGSCGRELCCSTWLTDFRSVSTNAARYQQLSLNPQKLAGQCGRLKCCLNYELDVYMDALKEFPKPTQKLRTKKGTAIHMKTDIFKKQVWYVYEGDRSSGFIPLEPKRANEIIAMNKKGEMPEDLSEFRIAVAPKKVDYSDLTGQDDLTRFDKKGGNNKGRSKNKKRKSTKNNPNSQNSKEGTAPQKKNPNSAKRKGKSPNTNKQREQKKGGNNNPNRKKGGQGKKPDSPKKEA